MFEKAGIILVEEADVGNAVFNHGGTFDAATESEAIDFAGIVTDEAIDARVNHSGAADFDPSGLFADAATLSAADVASKVKFHGRFGEREKVGTEADADILSHHFAGEVGKSRF